MVVLQEAEDFPEGFPVARVGGRLVVAGGQPTIHEVVQGVRCRGRCAIPPVRPFRPVEALDGFGLLHRRINDSQLLYLVLALLRGQKLVTDHACLLEREGVLGDSVRCLSVLREFRLDRSNNRVLADVGFGSAGGLQGLADVSSEVRLKRSRDADSRVVGITDLLEILVRSTALGHLLLVWVQGVGA